MNADRRPLTINGVQYRPTLEDVLAAMKGARTRPLGPGNWYCVVRGRQHPLKVVVATTLGLPRAAFTLPHAHAFARYVGLEFGKVPGRYVR